MNELTNEKYMSVSEVAAALNVTERTVQNVVKKLANVLSPVKNKQGGYLLTEEEASMISKEVKKAHNNIATRNNAVTEREEAEIVAQAMQIITRKLERLQEQAAEDRPKVEFFDAVADSKDAISIGDLAKILNSGIGRNKLFVFLRDNGILQHDNVPYQAYIDRGWFRTIEQKYTVPDGSTKISIKTLVYQKGVDAIRRILE